MADNEEASLTIAGIDSGSGSGGGSGGGGGATISYPFNRIFNSKLTVGTTATPAASKDVISHKLGGRVELVVHNTGTSTIYWGGADVTTENGIPIEYNQVVVFPVAGYDTERCVYLVGTEETEVSLAEMFV